MGCGYERLRAAQESAFHPCGLSECNRYTQKQVLAERRTTFSRYHLQESRPLKPPFPSLFCCYGQIHPNLVAGDPLSIRNNLNARSSSPACLPLAPVYISHPSLPSLDLPDLREHHHLLFSPLIVFFSSSDTLANSRPRSAMALLH